MRNQSDQLKNVPLTADASSRDDVSKKIVNKLPVNAVKTLAVSALLISLLTGVAIGLCWKQLKNAQTRSSEHIKELRTTIQQEQLVFQGMALQISNIQNTLQHQQADVIYNQSQLQRLLQNNPANVENHILLEAQYLVRQAALNLNFGHDVPTAILLLQTADQRVQSINDPNLTKVRQIFANTITALQAIPSIDLEGLLAQLSALRERIDALPLFSLPKPELKQLADIPESNAATGWKKALALTADTIQKLIIIRHRDELVVPLLSPNQELYLRQNLQLILQQAEWAALHHQENIYRSSLQQAIQWIKRYFHSNEYATQAMLASLMQLQKNNVQPALPSISPVLDALQQVLIQRTGSAPSFTLTAPEQKIESLHTPVKKENTK